MSQVHAVVMAAGQGTRMRSEMAKVLHQANGSSLLDWSLSSLSGLDLTSIAVVVGCQANAVTSSLASHPLAPLIATVLQVEQLGTGHAAAVGLSALGAAEDDAIVVVPGDMPLLQPSSLVELLESHRAAANAATVMSSRVENPSGYGRIIRQANMVVGIVEHVDATAEQEIVAEVNTSVYVFNARHLAACLERLTTNNAQGEQYLPDVIGMLAAAGLPVGAFFVDPAEATGVNDLTQLASADAALRTRHELVGGSPPGGDHATVAGSGQEHGWSTADGDHES